MKMRVLSLAAAAVAAFASPAFAQSTIVLEPNGRSIAVSYSDLNLGNQADIDVLRSRLNNAAWRVCLDYTRTMNARESAACRHTAVARGLSNVQDPVVLAALDVEQRPVLLASL